MQTKSIQKVKEFFVNNSNRNDTVVITLNYLFVMPSCQNH